MSIQALSEYIRIAKYARHLPEQNRRETWTEQVDRVFDMHSTKYAYCMDELAPHLAYAKQAVMAKQVLGSQRALQFGGEPILKVNARLFNCSVSFADRTRFFQEFMWMLLCGCGVGFSVQKHHVSKLPFITKPTYGKKTFVIPDTIEGWADAVGVLMCSYVGHHRPWELASDRNLSDYCRYEIEFDYSLIRPAGAPLSSGSKAPGPDGLRRSLEKIREILNTSCEKNFKWPDLVYPFEREDRTYSSLTPIEVYDICMHASDAVISGGVRRSATICIFSKDDTDMANAKTGDWYYTNPQRGRSNNSAMLLREETSFEEFSKLMQSVKQYGEPGFIWSDSTEMLPNPCVEIGMWPAIEKIINFMRTAVSGWQVCNLCEINGLVAKTAEIFYEQCRAAAILGTLQAGYTDFPYLGAISEEIIRREALLGVSITGLMDSPDVLFDPEVLEKGAEIVKFWNREIARILGINPAARTTCIKPAGTSSLVLGTASGIHPHHSKRYFKRVQANSLENPLKWYKAYNPSAVEASVWDPNGQTEVITFLCEVPKGSIVKNDVTAIDLLSKVKLVQKHWVTAGRNLDLCTHPWLNHNVSNTINVEPTEWDDVTKYIYGNRTSFAGISLLPSSGDKDYPQAPFCDVPTAKQIVSTYGTGSMFASGIITQANMAWGNNLWAACDALLGHGAILMPEQLNWINATKKFARNFFDDDLRKTSYCLKDVYNLNLWEKLSHRHTEVDWTAMSELEDVIDFAQEPACAGGMCALPDWFLDETYKEKEETND